MIRYLPGFVFMIALAAASAHADEVRDAYDAGYRAGYEAGKQEAISTFGSGATSTASGAVIIPGSEFDTTINTSAQSAGQEIQIPLDSSIAIIPNEALPEIQEKLGPDFLRENNILLNNGAAQ